MITGKAWVISQCRNSACPLRLSGNTQQEEAATWQNIHGEILISEIQRVVCSPTLNLAAVTSMMMVLLILHPYSRISPMTSVFSTWPEMLLNGVWMILIPPQCQLFGI